MSLMSVAESACHLEFREVIVRVPSQAVSQTMLSLLPFQELSLRHRDTAQPRPLQGLRHQQRDLRTLHAAHAGTCPLLA